MPDSTYTHVATLATANAEATELAGEALGGVIRPGDVVVLTGDLGAGKTQLSKGVAVGLGVVEPVTSPTFNILVVHKGRITLNHLDLYRLEHAWQLEDIDFDGTVESDAVSLIEWGDRFPERLPTEHVRVSIAFVSDDERSIRVESSGPIAAQVAAEWVAGCEGLVGLEVRR